MPDTTQQLDTVIFDIEVSQKFLKTSEDYKSDEQSCRSLMEE